MDVKGRCWFSEIHFYVSLFHSQVQFDEIRVAVLGQLFQRFLAVGLTAGKMISRAELGINGRMQNIYSTIYWSGAEQWII